MIAVGRTLTSTLWLSCVFAATGVAPAQTATEIVLHNFACPPKGANPYAGVIRDSAGSLYGTTYSGGPANAGVVYKLGPAGRLAVLHNFTGGADGAHPSGGVIGDSAGNLYGTTEQGGAANAGVVYKLDKTGRQTVLYSFTFGADGGTPHAGVIRDSAGNFYGTTQYGGLSGSGAVFRLDPAGALTVLHSFTGGADGYFPRAGVIRDSAGNLYGTTFLGGTAGQGVVYKVDPTGRQTVLYTFTGGADGANPSAAVIRDSAGNLYGTTTNGGATGRGVVYKLDTQGRETVLHTFTGFADGGQPLAGIIPDSAGNLYGTAAFGSQGVVYKLDTAGQLTPLYSFTGGADGLYPEAGVIRDLDGNLYGTTYSGGIAGQGVVYKLDPTGHQTVIYSFPSAADGNTPYSSLTRDSAGNFYGTTYSGGSAGQGTIYKLDTAGHESLIHSFTGGAEGGLLQVGVTVDSAGNLYGTTPSGGTSGAGEVYKVDAAGVKTLLYSFMGGADGGGPVAGVIRDAAGNLYGTTAGSAQWLGGGVVYKVDTAGRQTVLYSFTGGADGGVPCSGVIRDSFGNLYGTTSKGGSAGQGVVYKLDPAGHETVLYSFTGGADGGGPQAGVIRDAAGNLYGTTPSGGRWGRGVVYKG